MNKNIIYRKLLLPLGEGKKRKCNSLRKNLDEGIRFLIILLISFFIIIQNSFALTLQESIQTALKNNPSVVAQQKKYDAANAKLGQAVGAFFPTVKIDANYSHSYSQPSTTQFTIGGVEQTLTFGTDDIAKSKSWTASISQPLFVAALLPGFSIARKNAEMEKQGLNKSINETSFNVVQAYFGVLKARKMVELLTEAKEMASNHLNKVRAMLSAGVSTRADLLRTEVQMANAEVSLTRAKNGYEIAKDAFNNILGRNMDEEADLAEEEINVYPNLPTYKNLIDTAMQNRADWKQFILAKQMSEDSVKIAQSAYLPSLFLSGQTGNRVTEYPTYSSDVNSWTITGAASWTLFDGLATQNKIREAKANLDAQKASEEQVKNGIMLDVRDAYFNFKSAIEIIDSAKTAVESAEENYKVSNSIYNSGAGTNLEVISAQVSLTQAKINYFQSLYDLEIAKAKINKTVGKEII